MKAADGILILRAIEQGDFKKVQELHGAFDKTYGLCAIVLMHLDVHRYLYLKQVMIQWEHYSGNLTFPVPHRGKGAGVGYTMAVNKYDRRTKYGKLRLNLAGFLANELEKYEIIKETFSEQLVKKVSSVLGEYRAISELSKVNIHIQ